MTVVGLGADHAGFPLNEDLKARLIDHACDVVDFGLAPGDARPQRKDVRRDRDSRDLAAAKFQEGRHARRVDKIVALDRARSQESPDEQAR